VTKGSENVVMGNGNTCATSIVGDLIATMCNKNGKVLMPIKLGDVTCSNDVKFNLFSITAMLKKGWTMQGTKESITLKQGKKSICFDAVIDTPKGRLFTMLIKHDRNEEAMMFQANETKKAAKIIHELDEKLKKVNIANMHGMMGHMGEDSTRAVAKHLGIQLSQGTLKPCSDCAMAKAKKKALPKDSGHAICKQVNGRIYLDLSSIKRPKHLSKLIKVVNMPNWRLMVEEKTQLKISDFYKTKKGMVEPTCEILQKWKQQNKGVQVIRCDNGGGNIALQKRCQSKD
jgi:hypothetical protein